METVTPVGHRFRNGQWVRFELSPDDIRLVVIEGGNRVSIVKPEDPLEVQILVNKMQKSADGRFVGIFMAAAKAPTATIDANGNEEFAFLPACVVPQRAVLGLDGSQNIEFAYGGKAHTVMFSAESLRNVEAVLIREDVPAHRDATCYQNWNPRR